MKHNWEYKQLGDICDKGSSNLMQKNLEIIDNGFEVFGASGSLGKIDFYQQEAPYVGIVKDGSGVGRCNLYPAKSSLLGTMQYIIAKNCVSNEYLCYLMQSLNLSKYVNGAAIPHIYFRDYKKEIVPVPPMEVQERIVAELDKINETIEDCRELLRNLDALAQSLFYDFFGDPVINPKGWTLKPWSDCINIINGKNQKAVENPNGQFPIYGSGGIMSYADAYLCPEYCTIIGRKGNISKPIFVKTKFWNVDTAFGLCPDKSILAPLYLYFFCKNYDFEKHNKAVTIPSLVKGDLLKIQIPVPPLELQEKFAERIEQIDAQKKAVEETIANLQTLLDSRMDYWFN